MNDRELAIKVRRLLLAVIAMIEQYYKLGKHADMTISGNTDEVYDIVNPNNSGYGL